MSDAPDVLRMRQYVLAAIAANPAAGPESPEAMARLNDAGRDCSFEELGFDSLARMELCIFLETEYGIPVTVGEVEACATVNAMAAHLARTQGGI
jgi:hypothetical protein